MMKRIFMYAKKFFVVLAGESELRMALEDIEENDMMIIISLSGENCIWHIPTAGFAEQNGRNAKLNGRLPFDY